MDMNDAVTALESLAHETRLERVSDCWYRQDRTGLSAGEIAERLGALQNTMSSHLHKLSRAGIVESRRDGRHIIYSANFAVAERD